jgi:hypothetical protein
MEGFMVDLDDIIREGDLLETIAELDDESNDFSTAHEEDFELDCDS